MENDVIRLHELLRQGLGCSQAIVETGLEARGEENASLIRALGGLRGGMRSGLLCGALTGGACLLSLYDETLAAKEMIPKLLAWYRATYPDAPTDCSALLGGDRANRARVCPPLIEGVYCAARDILEDYGFDMRSAFEARFE